MKISVPDTLVYINSASGLNDIIEDLRKETLIAFDLEADSMFHFKEKVCLIQVATASLNYIIDPLSIPDLSPLSQILSDPDITKIFHGADYDVRSLYRDYQIAIHNLFDTELASRFLGNAETGLNTVLQNRFGITLEKKYQKKDWSQRPLPKPMIAYAAKDVQYLIPLYKIQQKELAEKERLEWVSEECRDLTLVRSGPLNERPLFTKMKGAGRLDKRCLAVLEALLEFRLSIAEAKDRPLFKVIGNASLTKIAVARPATMEQLIKTNALSAKQLNMYGNPILRHIKKALAMPEGNLPQYPYTRPRRISNDVSARFKTLKQWREQEALDLEIDPGVLINNTVLKTIAESNPQKPEDLDAIPVLKNWQKKELGKEITATLGKPETN
ncbi:MAG: ribonuclease D [Desulfobacteraceae bacterium]|nr:HRDC domain-containing protein [Desulfobacteraceae bacterium]MBC2755572.1 ribonuclease D [Desulfobacteraceae bacterium]